MKGKPHIRITKVDQKENPCEKMMNRLMIVFKRVDILFSHFSISKGCILRGRMNG